MKPEKNCKLPEFFDHTFGEKENLDAEFATNSLIMDEEYLKDKEVLAEIQVMEAKIDVDNNHK
ncbi:MAG: hypothetical protein R3Y12_01045 [Clostridia bacterium]